MKNLKASAELMEFLNKAITSELRVAIRYMRQHALWSGVNRWCETSGSEY